MDNNELLELHAYVDGQLSEEQVNALQAKLNTHEAFALQYTQLRLLKSTISRMPSISPEPKVWKQCVSRLDALDSSRKTERFVTKYAWGICGLFFLMILVGGGLDRMGFAKHIGTGEVSQVASGLGFGTAPSSSGQMPEILKNLQIPIRRLTLLGTQQGMINGCIFNRYLLTDGHGPLVLIQFNCDQSLDGLSPLNGSTDWQVGQIGTGNCVAHYLGNQVTVLVGNRSVQELHDILVGK